METILMFDLDGTIIDSSEGIFKGIVHAAEVLELNKPTASELRSFVGPPLVDSFQSFYGMDQATAVKAVAAYRDYYQTKGLTEVQPYKGMETALSQLAKHHALYVATSKPEVFAKTILKNLGFASYFTAIFGADLQGKREKKGDVIRYALQNIQPAAEQSVMMIGDREHDILGAKENHIQSAGVLFGFGTEHELREAGADWLIANPAELATLV